MKNVPGPSLSQTISCVPRLHTEEHPQPEEEVSLLFHIVLQSSFLMARFCQHALTHDLPIGQLTRTGQSLE